MSATNAAAVSIDDILDGTLDDIEDLPSFAAWPGGAYRCLLATGFVQKEINDNPAFELKLKCAEVLELSNAAEQAEAPKVGDECSLSFMMSNETGRGFFKEAIAPFVAHLGLAFDQKGAVRAAVDASKGLEVMAVMKRRSKKDDSGEVKYYPSLVKLEIL